MRRLRPRARHTQTREKDQEKVHPRPRFLRVWANRRCGTSGGLGFSDLSIKRKFALSDRVSKNPGA